MLQKNHIVAIIFSVFLIILWYVSGKEFLEMKKPVELFPSDGISKVTWLSDYHKRIKGTNADTEVFIFEGEEEGGTVLVLGGAHPNEPSGYMAAVLIVENLNVQKGRVIVIPQACKSGFQSTDPMEGAPQFFWIDTKSGPRRFNFGSRIARTLDQWPDPLVYQHYPSGQKFSGFDSRNLNRCYPGRANGTFTERIAYAIIQLIIEEEVDIAFDLHEAAPEYPIINAIVYHEKGVYVAMGAILDLEMEELSFAPELSPPSFNGLSHREWGDHTNAIPFLLETSNPAQGRLRGRTNEELILKGLSPTYQRAKDAGALRIVYRDEGEDLDHRVGRHISAILGLINSYNDFYPEKTVEISGLPAYHELNLNKLGFYLN